VCRKRGLIKTDKKTIFAIISFAIIATIMGIGLSTINIVNVWWLVAAISVFGILYLPTAFIVDRFIIK
jgi:uncharacterized membrane protein